MMRKSFGYVTAIFLLTGSQCPVWGDSQEAWKLAREGTGYKVYQRPSTVPSGLEAFRVVGILKANPIEVATAILDRQRRPEWMKDIRELRTVRVPGRGSVIEYSAVKTPFVLKDRDFVIQTDVEVDPVKKRIVIVSRSVIDPAVPPGADIRGNLIEGRFAIEPGDETGTSRLTADMDVDPKGSVPRWIVNRFQRNWPGGMFRSLERFISRKVATLPIDQRPIFTLFSDATPQLEK